jgi:hypothetical protein
MGTIKILISLVLSLLALSGCSEIKVIKPSDHNPNSGTKILDFSSGELRVVPTYTCQLASMGHQFSAIGKSEDEARKEVVAKCLDKALLTFCDSAKAACVKN